MIESLASVEIGMISGGILMGMVTPITLVYCVRLSSLHPLVLHKGGVVMPHEDTVDVLEVYQLLLVFAYCYLAQTCPCLSGCKEEKCESPTHSLREKKLISQSCPCVHLRRCFAFDSSGMMVSCIFMCLVLMSLQV